MNPFSRFLSQFLRPDDDIQLFIAHWDRLEALVVQVYKRQQVTVEQATAFAESWPWLRQQYGSWQTRLAPYWPEALVGGRPAPQDPFLRLLGADRPESFLDDWEALQYLPAAREALNRYLVASGEGSV